MMFSARFFHKSIAAASAVVFLMANVIFVHSAEINMWAARHQVMAPSHPDTLSAMPPVRALLRHRDWHSLSRYGAVRLGTGDSSFGKPIVLHIQDIHRNVEAQQNIAQAIL